MRALAVLALTTCAFACATVRAKLGVPGGQELEAKVDSPSGSISLFRFTPTADALFKGGGATVVVVPELGFDHRLVAPLCERLRDRGFDVVTFDAPRGVKSMSDFASVLASVVATVHPPTRILAVGVAGLAAFEVAKSDHVSGIVAVNVPRRLEIGDVALAQALADDLFSPWDWSRDDDRARLLFGGGHSTPPREVDRLAADSVPIDRALAADVADRLARHVPVAEPRVPIRVFASVRDNLVPPEDAFDLADTSAHVLSMRRLGKLEMFRRDYGHLDWLASDAALDDVTPALAGALGALP